MEYITTKEASAKWGISATRITILANEGRIPGAQRLGRSWLIPASATKPAQLKPNHSGGTTPNRTYDFSFPLYHFRPDWNPTKEKQLSNQQQLLLQAETAVMECRFTDVFPILEPILHAPDDIVTEIGCLWNAGITCIALNKSDEFSKIFLRLQMLLADDFPHRDDLAVILNCLETYVDTLSITATNDSYNTDIHDQCLPLTCMLIGYAQLTRETLTLGAADTTMLELMLRFLQTTSAVVTTEMVHIYLMSIYSLRNDMTKAQKHAKNAVQIAYENKIYFPLVTYYRYNTAILSPILAEYPKDFQNHCHKIFSQYETNFTSFFRFFNESSIVFKLGDADFPYIYAVSMGLSNSQIAQKLGVSPHTVIRRLNKLYEKLGVNDKKELREYLHKYM